MFDASVRGRSSRMKGHRGERELVNELVDLLGLDIRRRVRNHSGESDLTGLDGFSVEVKNQDQLSVGAWWAQTVRQAKDGEIPVLFYKVPRKGFRCVLSLSGMFGGSVSDCLTYTMEMSVPAFCMLYRETRK